MKSLSAGIAAFSSIVLALFFGAASVGYAQSRINYNNQDLFLNGSNIAWVNFAGDLGPSRLDTVSFRSAFDSISSHGGNALRLWLHTNGTQTPEFDDASGKVIGPGTNAIAYLNKILDMAWQRKIGLILCLWSFDMQRMSIDPSDTNRIYTDRNALMLNDTSYTWPYINNALIPLVMGVKGHPGIISWEVFNEPEGMSNEFGWSDIRHVPMPSIQRFVNLVAGAIHRTDSTAKVTNGTVSMATLTDVGPLAKQVDLERRLNSMTEAEKRKIEQAFAARYNIKMSAKEILASFTPAENKNYYRDDLLIDRGGDSLGILDFYTVHYYDWQNTPLSPFHHPYSAWNLTKPLAIAEFFPEQTLAIPYYDLYRILYNNGYAGALSWGWYSGAQGHSQATLQANTLALIQDLFTQYPEDVEISPVSGTIYSFTAEPTLIDSGESSVLNWKTALGTTATLNGGPVAIRGTLTVSPTATTMYTLMASGAVLDTSAVTVAVYPSGAVISFEASATNIGIGDPVKLQWKVSHGSVVSLNDSIVSRTDTIVVHPSSTTTYTLIAAGSDRDTSSITITAVPADQFNRALSKPVSASGSSPNPAYSNPRNIVDGDSTTLWISAASNNQWVICDLGQNVGIERVVVKWGGNYATAYRLSLMSDSGSWRLVRTINNGAGKTEVIGGLNQEGRYLQLWLDTRSSSFTGFGIRELEVYGVLHPVAINDAGTNIPDRFALFQNYPNPFNPSTTISFAVPTRSHVTISVFNVLGQRVAEIVNESMDAGYHSITWNASVASGIYFCRMGAVSDGTPSQRFQETRRVMLLK